MRIVALASLGMALFVIGAGAQTPVDSALHARLLQLFPDARAFSPKEGDPPHFTAYLGDPAASAPGVAGYAFWTTELEPLERAFDGPITILVGMNTRGVLTGVIVTQHHEPYGNFSIDPPSFAAQFRGKDVRDPFKVGADIDAVSRATITITSATRAIRNSSRRVARALLPPPPAK